MGKPDDMLSPEAYYETVAGRLDRLRQEAIFALQSAIEDSGIKIHSLTGRVKDKASYLEKISRKSYDNPAEQVEDLVGIRIVCLFNSDLAELGTIVKDTFNVLKEEDKIDGGAVDAFGYMSVHYVAELHSSNIGPRYTGLSGFKFEVQVRTILMDAWANVSHHLAYKGEVSIPDALKKDFFALAGLFYVADKHFEMFFNQSVKANSDAAVNVSSGQRPDALPLNRDTVAAVLREQYPGREEADLENASELAEELSRAGYTTVLQLQRDLREFDAAAHAYEADHPPYAERGRKYAAIGLARQALAIANANYRNTRYGYKTDEAFTKYAPLRVPTSD